MAKVEVLSRAAMRKLSVVQDSLEIIDWTLYDTQVVANGGGPQFTFFQQAVGQGGNTLETTNMDIGGQLPSGHKFVAQKVILQAIPSVFAGAATEVVDIFNVTHRGYAVFSIGTRPYLQAHCLDLIGGVLQGSLSTIDYAGGRTVINGEMEYSPIIPSTYAFNVQVTYPAALVLTADVNLRCKLIGKMIRPRQG